MSAKILPRNATAIHAAMTATVSGNPDTTRLESGVGNCYPGLEFDIRNLERRFFPYLEVDINEIEGNELSLRGVDIDAVNADGNLSEEQKNIYLQLHAHIGIDSVEIIGLSSDFKEFGMLTWDGRDFRSEGGDPPAKPVSLWTAIRLIPSDTPVTLRFRISTSGQNQDYQLTANRIRYMSEDGALSPAYVAGEMTQTLCQPWSYDFRDCGCWYWATNHPDTVQAEVPSGMQPNAVFDRPTNWLRSTKTQADGGPLIDRSDHPGRTDDVDMKYYELAERWNELGIVLDGREQGDVYAPHKSLKVDPIPQDKVIDYLRYAAAVEHSVMTEYLTAVYSLNPNASGNVKNDVVAAHADILRIAYGEMRHMRLANDLLRLWCEHIGLEFEPVLAPAAELPAGDGNSRPVEFRRLTESTLSDFIDIERPSFSVDGLYTRLLESMRSYAPHLSSIVETIIAEGNDHFETFLYIKDWLGDHQETDYLLDLRHPGGSDPEYVQVRDQYHAVLHILHSAYTKDVPAGAAEINAAREIMVKDNGLRDSCRAARDAGLMVIFEAPVNDERFTPISRPQHD